MWLEVKRLFNWGAAPMVSFISFVFAATINKLPLTKRERGFISAFLPTAAPADKGLGRCEHWHIFNDWLNEFPISDCQRKDMDFFSIDTLWYHCNGLVTALYPSWVLFILYSSKSLAFYWVPKINIWKLFWKRSHLKPTTHVLDFSRIPYPEWSIEPILTSVIIPAKSQAYNTSLIFSANNMQKNDCEIR